MKSLTLSILPLHFGMGSFWVWHMGPQKTKARWRMPGAVSTPATPAASRPRRALVIAFLLTLPFCFCVDAEKPARTLRHLCFIPSLLLPPLFVAFVRKRKKKTAKVKSPQSTSNRRSSPFLPVSFSSDSGCPLAPVACFSPLSNSDVGHFTFVTSKTRDCP